MTLLSACGGPNADDAIPGKVEAARQATRDADDRLMCAKSDADFTRSCTLDREGGPDGVILTVRHPDGGFRRLLVTGDGRGVIAADGAEPAHVTMRGDGEIEIALGGDRYRLPATARPQ